MKTSILTLASIVLLTSCTKSIQDKVVDYTKNQMKDPRSFELASVKVTDTITKSDVLLETVLAYSNLANIEIEKSKTALELAKIWSGSYYSSYRYDEYMQESQEALNRAKPYAKSLDSLQVIRKKLFNTPQDSVVGYKFYVSAYAKNSFNARMLGQWFVTTDTKGTQFTLEEAKSFEQEELDQQLKVNEAKLSVF